MKALQKAIMQIFCYLIRSAFGVIWRPSNVLTKLFGRIEGKHDHYKTELRA